MTSYLASPEQLIAAEHLDTQFVDYTLQREEMPKDHED
jgi:hypothetical protein